MYDSTVYGPRLVGVEKLEAFERMPNGYTVRLFSGLSLSRRVTLSDARGKGIAGLWIDRHGIIQWRETAESHRGQALTKQLIGWLASRRIIARASPWQTESGRACYKVENSC